MHPRAYAAPFTALLFACPAPDEIASGTEAPLDADEELPATSSDDTSGDASSTPTSAAETSTDAAETDAPGSPEPSCGDGVLDADEGCDLGPANDDQGACTDACQPAACGDGLVHLGVEACDLGPANDVAGACTPACEAATCGDGLIHIGVEACDLGPANSDEYGGCALDCTLGPRCGDGVVQQEHEECELGERGPEGVECGPGCRRAARIIFITSAAFDGDLGGLDGADLECRLAAQAAGLPGWQGYRAWLSDDTGSPLTRFVHDEGTAGLRYVLLSGAEVAADFDALLAHGPSRGIDVTEALEMLPAQRLVWTNTAHTGAALSPDDHCDRWTSSDPARTARVGMASAQPAAEAAWKDKRLYTSFSASGCASAWRLYCVEQ